MLTSLQDSRLPEVGRKVQRLCGLGFPSLPGKVGRTEVYEAQLAAAMLSKQSGSMV
jgi:hypothetical protein